LFFFLSLSLSKIEKEKKIFIGLLGKYVIILNIYTTQVNHSLFTLLFVISINFLKNIFRFLLKIIINNDFFLNLKERAREVKIFYVITTNRKLKPKLDSLKIQVSVFWQ
jgi:hypothetical protein